MHHLSKVQVPGLDLAQPESDGIGLLKPSAVRLNAATEDALALLMAQTKARYPNQELLPLTVDMYLMEWEEMVVRHGLDPFVSALSKVIRNRERMPFFPAPDEIEAELRSSRKAKRERQDTRDHITAMNIAKTVWMLERAEDIANGIPRAPLAPTAVDIANGSPYLPLQQKPCRQLIRRQPPQRHSEAEIAAFKANIPPEQMEAARERVRALLAKEQNNENLNPAA